MTVDGVHEGRLHGRARRDANFIFVDIKRDSRGFQDACRKKGVARRPRRSRR